MTDAGTYLATRWRMNNMTIAASLLLTLTVAPALAQEVKSSALDAWADRLDGLENNDDANVLDNSPKALRKALAAFDHVMTAGDADAPTIETAGFYGKDGQGKLSFIGLEQEGLHDGGGALGLGGDEILFLHGAVAWSAYGELECLAPSHPSYDDLFVWFGDEKLASGSRRAFVPVPADDATRAGMGTGVLCIAYDGDKPRLLARIGVPTSSTSLAIEVTRVGLSIVANVEFSRVTLGIVANVEFSRVTLGITVNASNASKGIVANVEFSR